MFQKEGRLDDAKEVLCMGIRAHPESEELKDMIGRLQAGEETGDASQNKCE